MSLTRKMIFKLPSVHVKRENSKSEITSIARGEEPHSKNSSTRIQIQKKPEFSEVSAQSLRILKRSMDPYTLDGLFLANQFNNHISKKKYESFRVHENPTELTKVNLLKSEIERLNDQVAVLKSENQVLIADKSKLKDLYQNMLRVASNSYEPENNHSISAIQSSMEQISMLEKEIVYYKKELRLMKEQAAQYQTKYEGALKILMNTKYKAIKEKPSRKNSIKKSVYALSEQTPMNEGRSPSKQSRVLDQNKVFSPRERKRRLSVYAPIESLSTLFGKIKQSSNDTNAIPMINSLSQGICRLLRFSQAEIVLFDKEYLNLMLYSQTK